MPDYKFKIAAYLPRSGRDLPRVCLVLQPLNGGRSKKSLATRLIFILGSKLITITTFSFDSVELNPETILVPRDKFEVICPIGSRSDLYGFAEYYKLFDYHWLL